MAGTREPQPAVFELQRRAPEGHRPGKLDAVLLGAAMAAAVTLTAGRLSVTLPRGTGLTFVSGIWLTYADDFADGVLYRPLSSERGYGGTRYMPLYFVLIGVLIRLGVAPVAAGYALTFASAGALASGVYVLTRRLAGGVLLSAFAAVAWLAFVPAQHAVATVRGDLLPAALNVWGLALVLRVLQGSGMRWLAAAAVLFGLAFAAKLTTVFGLAAGVAALALSGRRRHAFALAGMGILAIAAVSAVTFLTSGGRWLDGMRGAQGSLGLKALAAGVARFGKFAVDNDPFGASMWALCIAAIIPLRRQLAIGLPCLAFLATAAATAVLFASPGTEYNHFLDLDVAAVVLLASLAAKGAAPGGAAVLAMLTVLATGGSYVFFYASDHADQYRNVRAAAAQVPAGPGRIMSDNALVPLAAGEHAYLPDRFMFALQRRLNPSHADDLMARLAIGRFRAVVLSRPRRDTTEWRAFYDGIFGKTFVPVLEQEYRFVSQHGPYEVYLPRDGGPTAP